MVSVRIHYRGSPLQKGLTYEDTELDHVPRIGEIIRLPNGLSVQILSVEQGSFDSVTAVSKVVERYEMKQYHVDYVPSNFHGYVTTRSGADALEATMSKWAERGYRLHSVIHRIPDESQQSGYYLIFEKGE